MPKQSETPNPDVATETTQPEASVKADEAPRSEQVTPATAPEAATAAPEGPAGPPSPEQVSVDKALAQRVYNVGQENEALRAELLDVHAQVEDQRDRLETAEGLVINLGEQLSAAVATIAKLEPLAGARNPTERVVTALNAVFRGHLGDAHTLADTEQALIHLADDAQFSTRFPDALVRGLMGLRNDIRRLREDRH